MVDGVHIKVALSRRQPNVGDTQGHHRRPGLGSRGEEFFHINTLKNWNYITSDWRFFLLGVRGKNWVADLNIGKKTALRSRSFEMAVSSLDFVYRKLRQIFWSFHVIDMQWTRDGRELHFLFSEIFIACVIVWLVLHLAFNPLQPKSDLWTLLCLTPVEFTLSKASEFYSV